jgi:hypothetical protein
MDKGNEGDQILFLAFSQIECQIPPEIDSVAKLTPDLVVEIIVRSLALISNGEIKVCIGYWINLFLFN